MTPHLIALDLDGTVVHHDGRLDERVRSHIQRLFKAGHEVVVATGRSVDATLPLIEELKIRPDWVICCNGAVTLRRDPLADRSYRQEYLETFDVTSVLTRIRPRLFQAKFAVEDAKGVFHYTEDIPSPTLPLKRRQVTFDQLLGLQATRVVVVSPDHSIEEFLDEVEELGLSSVSYAIGWTAWLDIAPEGVNKAYALERVSARLKIPRERVFAAGDGRNDLEMLTWAAQYGYAAAMGQGAPEVHRAAGRVVGTVEEEGLVQAFEERFPWLAEEPARSH